MAGASVERKVSVKYSRFFDNVYKVQTQVVVEFMVIQVRVQQQHGPVRECQHKASVSLWPRAKYPKIMTAKQWQHTNRTIGEVAYRGNTHFILSS